MYESILLIVLEGNGSEYEKMIERIKVLKREKSDLG